MQPADRLRGTHALVASGRGHADVDDRDVGLGCGHALEQLLAAARLRDDAHTGLLEEACDAVANEHRVVREHDSQPVVVDPASEAQRRKVGG